MKSKNLIVYQKSSARLPEKLVSKLNEINSKERDYRTKNNFIYLLLLSNFKFIGNFIGRVDMLAILLIEC